MFCFLKALVLRTPADFCFVLHLISFDLAFDMPSDSFIFSSGFFSK